MARRGSWGLAAALSLVASTGRAEVSLHTQDGEGRLRSAARSRASLERLPPEEEPADPRAKHHDPDALRYIVSGGESDPGFPAVLALVSRAEDGRELGRLELPLVDLPCPEGLARPKQRCATTAPVRVVIDEVDARHPLTAHRSVIGGLAGRLRITAGERLLGEILVTGPRATPAGPIERQRAKLRFVVLRVEPGGAPSVGDDDAGARDAAAQAQQRVDALWGACGLAFGPNPEVQVVDPPPPHLVSLGCGYGLSATGGDLSLVADGHPLTLPLRAGESPAGVARRLAQRLEAAGFVARISDNPAMASATGASTDLSVRRRDGKLVTLAAPPGRAVSRDATFTACIGGVSLLDGLEHFADVDAVVGTLEERTLVKAYDDGDPRTLDVFIIPGFARGGRIGESFIGADHGTLRNLVVVDRAGMRSNLASFTLAHEIGHVLLDDPGHPDDFAADQPTRLMDADAVDGSAFGPRRLSLGECASMLRQSGARASVPLLSPWPIPAP
ncbi:MAG: hypothetical protein KC731_03760 [Myxococcales bacterium]|nr:hypothetical protein [Myxococcales bacterium]